VPELWEVAGAAKIRIFGPAEALDRLEIPDGVGSARVAPDEVLWLADPGRAGELEEAAGAQVASLGSGALVVDHSDGWVLLSIVGDGCEEVLARVSSLRVPDGGAGFIQGQIAQAPGKVFCRPGRLDLLVGTDLVWFVRGRIEHAGRDAGLTVGHAPEAQPVSNGAAVRA
jgi:hypothetical protein